MALATLRRCQRGLAHVTSTHERDRLIAAMGDALRLLEATERRIAASELADRIASLERALSHMNAGQRATAIRERLGISKSAYYRLRGRSKSHPSGTG